MRQLWNLTGLAVALLLASPTMAENACPANAIEKRNAFFDQCLAKECGVLNFDSCPKPTPTNVGAATECIDQRYAAYSACSDNCFNRGMIAACNPEPESSGIFPKN